MKRHKYKATLAFGLSYEFESKHHISDMEVMAIPNASYIRFDDAGVVLDLTQVKKMDIDGIEYKMKAYLV